MLISEAVTAFVGVRAYDVGRLLSTTSELTLHCVRDLIMNTSRSEERIWLNPPKFWAATKNMSEAEVERLVEQLFHLAERRDIEALKKYDFIVLAGRAVPNFFRQH